MIEFEAHLGERLGDIYRNAVGLAEKKNDIVHFSGNGIDFYADKDSLPTLVERYIDSCYRYDIKSLGPKEPEWSKEFIEQKETEYREYQRKMEEEWKRSAEEMEKDYQDFLNFVKDEEIEVNDPSQLEEFRKTNSDHFYGRTCVAFLEDIAKYLQVVKRSKGNITKEDVNKGEKLIRKHGITGFQHSCIVNVLRQIWKHWEKGLF